MTEYAPASLKWLGQQAVARIPSAVLSGIIGDRAHTYGYHRARNYLPAGDYSRQLPDDKLGDGEAASAIDISLNTTQMKIVTGRLIASADDRNDPRLDSVREFYGTTNGTTVTGRDIPSGRVASSDSSHLWHIHISVLRKYSGDLNAAKAILSVMVGETVAQWRAATGQTPATPQEEVVFGGYILPPFPTAVGDEAVIPTLPVGVGGILWGDSFVTLVANVPDGKVARWRVQPYDLAGKPIGAALTADVTARGKAWNVNFPKGTRSIGVQRVSAGVNDAGEVVGQGSVEWVQRG